MVKLCFGHSSGLDFTSPSPFRLQLLLLLPRKVKRINLQLVTTFFWGHKLLRTLEIVNLDFIAALRRTTQHTLPVLSSIDSHDSLLPTQKITGVHVKMQLQMHV